jgi:hypothetical protein
MYTDGRMHGVLIGKKEVLWDIEYPRLLSSDHHHPPSGAVNF